MSSIGIFTYSTRPRGSVVHATRLAEALLDARHDAVVYALGKPGAPFYRPLRCPVEIFSAAEAPSDPDALVQQRIGEFILGFERVRSRMARHDVLHAQDCLAASALLEARRPGGAAIARTVHHVESFESPHLTACQERSIREADAVFAVSRMTQRDVKRIFDRDAALVPNGVDLARFDDAPPVDAASLSREYGIEQGDIVVLSVGGIEERKNTRRAFAAVRSAFEAGVPVRWIIAGGASFWDHSAYRRLFEADLARAPKGLRLRVVRTGPIEDHELTAIYLASDVFLFPSAKEGFGLSVIEAMAARAAAVVPFGAPFDEYLDASCARLVDPASERSIAAGLIEVARDAGLRGRLTRAARSRARAFSWSRSADVHAHLYARLRRPAGAEPRPETRHA